MGVNEIPAKFVFECDTCGAKVTQEHHHGTDRPAGWVWVRAHGDRVKSMLLCVECNTMFENYFIEKARSNKGADNEPTQDQHGQDKPA